MNAHSIMASSIICIFASLAFSASGDNGSISDDILAAPSPQLQLLRELDIHLGVSYRNATEKRLHDIEHALRPTFEALPKNRYGKLSHAAARYALHRLFVHRQGWVISGLESANEAPTDSSVAGLLEHRAPRLVREGFEEVFSSSEGVSLPEVAVMAATLEHLIHDEVRSKLRAAYQVRNMSVDTAISRWKAHDLVDLYMMSYIRGVNLSSASPQGVAFMEHHINSLYPPWRNLRSHLRTTEQELLGPKTLVGFEDILNVLAHVGERFVGWQDTQCTIMKDKLLAMEDRGSGRVRLLDFYNSALKKGYYQFTETVIYLREIGNLDESRPEEPRVIIPNYVSGPNNCVSRTTYYSVCCLNECENIFSHLEASLGKPEATPAAIVSAISDLPPKEKRMVSGFLVEKLDEVAAAHGGLVPLHGRLFAQWMHLVYPRDCNYPHKSGTMYKRTMEEWERETGQHTGSTMTELKDWVARLSSNTSSSAATEALYHLGPNVTDKQVSAIEARNDEVGAIIAANMWTSDEELIVAPHSLDDQARTEMATVHCLAFVLALGATLLSVLRLSSVSIRLKKVGGLGPKKRPTAKLGCEAEGDHHLFRV